MQGFWIDKFTSLSIGFMLLWFYNTILKRKVDKLYPIFLGCIFSLEKSLKQYFVFWVNVTMKIWVKKKMEQKRKEKIGHKLDKIPFLSFNLPWVHKRPYRFHDMLNGNPCCPVSRIHHKPMSNNREGNIKNFVIEKYPNWFYDFSDEWCIFPKAHSK